MIEVHAHAPDSYRGGKKNWKERVSLPIPGFVQQRHYCKTLE
jgi:hypothetical protein